jgi:hypothetical protein
VLAATAAEFTKFKTLRGCLLILGRHVITAFAVRALQDDVIARHNFHPSKTETSIQNLTESHSLFDSFRAIQ